MELKPNAGSDRAWVWNTYADYADEAPKPELLAIRFLNAESEYCIWIKSKTCDHKYALSITFKGDKIVPISGVAFALWDEQLLYLLWP